MLRQLLCHAVLDKGQDGTDLQTCQRHLQRPQQTLQGFVGDGQLLEQRPLVQIQGIGVNRLCRLTHGIMQHQSGRSEVSLLRFQHQTRDDGLQILRFDDVQHGLAQGSYLAGPGVTGSALVAPGKATAGVTLRSRSRLLRFGAGRSVWFGPGSTVRGLVAFSLG